MSIAIITATILVVAAIAIATSRVMRWRHSVNHNLQRLLRAISNDAMVDFIIPNGAGGEIHIDHLLLTSHGFILLDTKDMAGTVFAGERMDVWSATHAGARMTFNNPIPQLQERAAAISLLAPNVPIESRVLFINNATFPKGHPLEVATVQALIDEYRLEVAGREPHDFNHQWSAIKSAAAAA